MTFEIDVAAWNRAATRVEQIAAALTVPAPLPLPTDRYACALGEMPTQSDAEALARHRDALAQLSEFAAHIRNHAQGTVEADQHGADQIAAAW